MSNQGAIHVPKIKYIFKTANETARGLMGVYDLGKDDVALFVMPKNEVHHFYMKNTPLPLDIIFMDKHGFVLGILKNMRPFDEKSKNIGIPSKYVLEANAGYVKRQSIIPFETTILLPRKTISKSRSKTKSKSKTKSRSKTKSKLH